MGLVGGCVIACDGVAIQVVLFHRLVVFSDIFKLSVYSTWYNKYYVCVGLDPSIENLRYNSVLFLRRGYSLNGRTVTV